MSKQSCFFEGFIIGGLIGAAVGLLYAPAAGSKTRGNLQKKLNEGLNGPSETLSQDEIKKLLTKTKDAVETGMSSLKAQVDALKQQRQQK